MTKARFFARVAIQKVKAPSIYVKLLQLEKVRHTSRIQRTGRTVEVRTANSKDLIRVIQTIESV